MKKILYAVQATGNGHIARARIMARAFKAQNIPIDWIFTGRKKQALFDMEEFGDYRVLPGLTFSIEDGRVSYIKTLFKNNLFKFIKDVFTIDVATYDLVINDFEPITAWACRLTGVKCIGLSNQMSLNANLPIDFDLGAMKYMVKYFAPNSIAIGIHWQPFSDNIVPPLMDVSHIRPPFSNREILVYFPFCSEKKLIDVFKLFPEYQFHIFHGSNNQCEFSHIKFYCFSKAKFKKMQLKCSGVITAAGFELPSEAIHLGHKLLMIPLQEQIEQQVNARIMDSMARATVVNELTPLHLKQWLATPQPTSSPYPDVATELVQWINDGAKEPLSDVSSNLWSQFEHCDKTTQVKHELA